MPTPPTDYSSAAAWCVNPTSGDYGKSDVIWDEVSRSISEYGPYFAEPSAGTTPYDNLDITPRAEIDGGPALNYYTCAASCNRDPRSGLDYAYSDMGWSYPEGRSLCSWPPVDTGLVTTTTTSGDTKGGLSSYDSAALGPLYEIGGRYIEGNPTTGMAPWTNSTLIFSVDTGKGHIDPETGNYIPILEQITYTAFLKIQEPGYDEKQGADVTAYQVSGRILSPSVLDERIQNGAQAEAVVNGRKGRFEFRLPLNQMGFTYPILRQQIQGLFHIAGSGGPN